MMELLRPLPPGRSYEQLKNHYLVEKAIADRLKNSNREERTTIFASMYDELFSKVPDHPRLSKRRSKGLTSYANKSKFSILNHFLSESDVFLEFAPGDCRFAFEVADKVKHVYGIDISDQRNTDDKVPDNFKLIIYDGYNLDEIESDSIDVVFSDQFIEHLHVDDTKHHFDIVYRILKKGGKYVFRAPHPLTGPPDVSMYFSDEPEGFHLKEWPYTEMKELIMGHNYSEFHTYWNKKGINIRLPNAYYEISELILGKLPKKYIRGIADYLIPSLNGVAIK